MLRRTKIVATIGPASDSEGQLRALMEAGMDVARLGFAHGDPGDQIERARRIRSAAHAVGRPVGLLADLPGPKIRAGEFPEGGVFLAEGAELRLVPGAVGVSGEHLITVDHDTLLDDVNPGDVLWIGDGAVGVLIEAVERDALVGRVRNAGRVQGCPGIHFPSERLRIDVPTPRDLELLELVVDFGFDFAAISFVRSAEDMLRTRSALRDSMHPLMLVAKIETRAAVGALDEIIEASDAVMVARGDLGIECALEDVPHLQKRIIRQCIAFGRPVITATQMLESMIHAPIPTRAEATDVANAVFDGTDALMLSAETAIGANPVAAVETMGRIAARAEAEADYVQWGARLGKLQQRAVLSHHLVLTGAITHAAWQAALEADAAAIVCCTRSGATVRAIARFRPTSRLLALTPETTTARQLSLTWGAVALEMAGEINHEHMVAEAIRTARDADAVRPGEVVAVLTGAPFGAGIDALRLIVVPTPEVV